MFFFDWIRNRVETFFWGSVATAAIASGSAFSPHFNKQVTDSLHSVHDIAKKNAPKIIADRIPDLPIRPKPAVDSLPRPKAGHEQAVSGSNEYVVDNRHYVLIEGRYYLAREDNTYMVNGRRVFYVNNRKYQMDPKSPNGTRVVTVSENVRYRTPGVPEVQGASATGSRDVAGAAAIESSSTAEATGDTARVGELPTSPAEMMKAIQDAQIRMKARDDALDQLMKDE